MGKRQKKRRQKRYRPAEGTPLDRPVVHKFSAEEETKKDSKKKLKRRLILAAILLLPVLLLLWLLT